MFFCASYGPRLLSSTCLPKKGRPFRHVATAQGRSLGHPRLSARGVRCRSHSFPADVGCLLGPRRSRRGIKSVGISAPSQLRCFSTPRAARAARHRPGAPTSAPTYRFEERAARRQRERARPCREGYGSEGAEADRSGGATKRHGNRRARKSPVRGAAFAMAAALAPAELTRAAVATGGDTPEKLRS